MAIRYGVCNWIMDSLGDPSCCAALAKEGFAGIQLDLGSHTDCFPLSYGPVQTEWKRQAALHGLTLCSIMINEVMRNGMIAQEGSSERKTAEQAIRVGIETAAAMGVPRVVVPSFRASNINTEDDFQRTAACLKQACTIAAPLGVTVASENVLAPAEAKRLNIQAGESLELYVDLFNYAFWSDVLLAEALPELMLLNGNELHIKNGTMEHPGSIPMAVPGIAQLEASLSHLKHQTFNGWIFLENFYERPVFQHGGLTAQRLLHNDLQWVRNSLS